METIISSVQRFGCDEKGATAVEYSLLIAFIASVIIATVTVLGSKVQAGYCAILTGLGGTC